MTNKTTMLFNHTGQIGDLIYSLQLIDEFKDATHLDIWLNIQTNAKIQMVKDSSHPGIGLSEADVSFILPLLKTVKFIDKITFGDDIPKNNRVIDLSIFRKCAINFSSGDIRQWIYNVIGIHLPQDFSKQHIFITPDFRFKDKVILVKTKRYNNALLDLNQLKNYANRFVFIGLENEHNEFEQNHFKVDYYKVKDALEFAQLLAGAQGIISNQTSLFAIAEMMKVPRLLLTAEWMKTDDDKFYPGPVNVHPQGGWFEVVQTNEKLKSAVENLLNK